VIVIALYSLLLIVDCLCSLSSTVFFPILDFHVNLCVLYCSSVSLLPYSIFKRLNLGKLRPTAISLQLTNRSVKYSLGISEDFPVKVGDFMYLWTL